MVYGCLLTIPLYVLMFVLFLLFPKVNPWLIIGISFIVWGAGVEALIMWQSRKYVNNE